MSIYKEYPISPKACKLKLSKPSPRLQPFQTGRPPFPDQTSRFLVCKKSAQIIRSNQRWNFEKPAPPRDCAAGLVETLSQIWFLPQNSKQIIGVLLWLKKKPIKTSSADAPAIPKI